MVILPLYFDLNKWKGFESILWGTVGSPTTPPFYREPKGREGSIPAYSEAVVGLPPYMGSFGGPMDPTVPTKSAPDPDRAPKAHMTPPFT